MKKYTFLPLALLFFLLTSLPLSSAGDVIPNNSIPVRGFCCGAPSSEGLDEFVKFIGEELAPRQINTLIVMIGYQYEFKSHPELRGQDPLTKKDVKKIGKVCRENNIRLIPQINLLGHQSWASHPGNVTERLP